MDRITVLDRDSLAFPPINTARHQPDGLLAAGGDLSIDRLVAAYRQGIFPWYEEGQPILWWSPDPRAVLYPADLRITRSLGKLLRQNRYEVTLDRDFDAVIEACSQPRSYAEGTWISPEMMVAYRALHREGIAHSVECYIEGELSGGLYGIGLGRMFFGESMFHHRRDASKIAFAHLVRLLASLGCPMIDCQISNLHLTSLGATTIPREVFADYLNTHAASEGITWQSLPRALPAW